MSPSLFFDNKKYISAKEASALTGYSRDYIGQLVRGNKVDSKRVGRVWYVGEESILKYNNFKKYISAKEASALTGYSRDYIGQLARDHKVDSKRVGRVWYVGEESILKYNSSSLKLEPLLEFKSDSDSINKKIPEPEPVLADKIQLPEIAKIPSKKISFIRRKGAQLVLTFLLILGISYLSNFNLSALSKKIASFPGNLLSAILVKSEVNPPLNYDTLANAFKNYLSPKATLSLSDLNSFFKNYISKPGIKNTAGISSSLPAKIITLRGPAGPKGATGSQGPMGPAGSSNNIDTSSFISNSFLNKQVNRIFDSISNNLESLSDALHEAVSTKLLTVIGNTTLGDTGTDTVTIHGATTLDNTFTQTGITNINATGTAATNIGNSTGILNLASGGASGWTNTAGDLTIQTNTSGTMAIDSAGIFNLGTVNSTATNLGKVATTLTINPTAWTATPIISGLVTATSGLTSNGAITIQNDSNFSQTGIGTFSTGTGAVSLNGATTVTGSNTFSTGTGAVELKNVSTNISAFNPIIDLNSASTLSINTVNNRPVTFGTGNITIPNLYVTNYEQNSGTSSITSSVPTGTIFSVTDNAITNGTLIGNTLTANAGNGEMSNGQIITVTDATTAGGGYTGLKIAVSGAGTGSGEKNVLDLNPGVNQRIVFDSTGALRPTTSATSNTNTIGSPTYYWKNGYFDQITANNIAGVVASGATSSTSWTIGSTQTSDVKESLIFYRNNLGAGNATLQWNSGLSDLRYFNTNYPFNASYTVDDTSIGADVNLLSGNLTNNTTSGTQKLLSLSNTGTGVTENGIYLNNTGTGTTGIEIAGTWTTGLLTNNNSINAGSGTVTAATFSGSLTGNASLDLPLAGGTMTGGITNSTSLNPLTTLAESWIGPSSTTGIYFKDGNVGFGTTSPSAPLSVGATSQFQVSSTGAVTAVGLNSESGLIQGTGGLTITGTVSLPNSSITNAMLANSTISGIALGSNLSTLTFGTHLTGTSYNGSTGVTLGTDATDANTASTIVARDASGNFSAGTITGSLTGHSSLDLPLAGGTMTGGITNSTSLNPLTTLAESWIGPSSTTGVYFKDGNVGVGTTTPSAPLSVGATSQFQVSSAGAVTAVGVNSGSGLIQGTGGLTIIGTVSLPNSSITNAMLANSTISGIALGSNLSTLTFGTHLTGTSYNGSTGVTLGTDATDANTASTIVARDASGNFSAGTITGSLTGHSSLDLPLAGGTMTGGITNSTSLNPLTTLAESWIGPSSTTGVYFKGGNVGVGTTSPDSLMTINANTVAPVAPPATTYLHLVGADSATTRAVIDTYSGIGILDFRRAAGTAASPSALASGAQVGSIGMFGYGTTGYSSGSRAQINFMTDEAWTDTAQGSRITFFTNTNGATSLTERMRIDNAGSVGIGITSPTSLLHTVSSAAKTTSYTGVLHSVTDTSSTASINKIGMDIESTGTWNGTSAVNTGLVVNATGGTTNYAATFSGGNVGIGTTSPGANLNILASQSQATASYNRGILFESYGSGAYGGKGINVMVAGGTKASPTTVVANDVGQGMSSFYYDGTTWRQGANIVSYVDSVIAGTSVSSGFKIRGGTYTGDASQGQNTGQIDIATFTPAGSVGIGITAPTSLLHTVSSAAKTTSYTGVLHSVTDTSSTASINKIGMDIESTGTWNGTSAINTGLVVNATGGTTNYAATFSGGNVGIGTATPMAQTEIYGAGQLTAALTDAGVKTGTLAINSNSGSAGAGGAIVFGNSQSETVSSIGYAAIKGLLTNGTGNTIGDLAFSTRNATGDTALTERMRILSSGNVGIGTVTPTYKLYVNNDVTNPTSAVLGIGSYVKITNNLSTDTYDHFAGNFGINPYGSQNYTGSVRGIAGSLYHYGTGTITNGYGMLFYGGVMSTGNITNLSLAKLGAYGTGTGVINTIKGLDISSMSDSGTPVNSYAIYVTSNTASSGTNKYGLYIGDISGAATANYALYSSSGTNYFGGNVGIGITAPTSLLHTVSSAAKTTAYTGILHSVTDTSSTASINKIGMDIESTGTWNGTSAVNTGLVVNATGGTTNYAATFSGGNVGIGTTTPSGILHAVNSALTSTAIFERSGQTSNSIFAGVRVLTTKTSDMGDGFGTALAFNIQDDAGVINPIGSIGAVRNGADNTGNLVFYPYNAGSATLAMTINNNGSVGIGTTSPTSLLHTVSSAAKTTAYTGILHNVTDTSSTASINKIGMDIESTGTWNGTSAVNTGLVVNATGGTTNYAATFSGGNVGIGTATPGYKLDVAGAGHFSGNLTLDTGASQSFVGIFSVTGSDSHAIRLYPSLAVGSFNGLTQAGDSALIFTNGSVNTGNLVIGPWGNYGLRITNTGSVGVGVSSPTAYLHLNAGTATASTAPLKFTSGTNLTTAEAGAMEYDGTQLYFSPSTTRNILAQVSGSTALTAGSIPFISTTSGYLTQNNANFFWDNTNNRLGVGTTSPTQMLSVGSSSQFNVTSAGAITATKITSSLTYTTTSGTSMTDNPIIYSNPTAGTSGSYRAGVFQAVQQGSYNNTGNIMGINGQAQHQGTGTLANAYGLNFAVYNAPGAGNTNVLTNAYGVYSFVMNQGTVAGAVISNAYSLYAGGLNNGSGGTVTNTYGVYIESQTAGIQTNSPFGLYQAGASDKNYFAGNVGIGTTSPGAPLEVKGSVTHATIAKFTDASDTTSCTFSSGGLIACSSDARLKKNVEDMNYGLSTVMSLRPVLYNWNYETDGSVKNLGFIAQEVEALVPKLVSTDEEGMKSLNSIGMVPIAIKAIQELNLNLEGVAGTVTPIPGSSSESFVTAFFTNIKIKIGTWLADAGNGIGNVFANVFNAKEKICVDGECLTKDDVHALLLLAHPPSTTSEPVTDQPSAETPAPTEPATPPSTSASAVEPVVETPTPEVTTPSTDSGQTSSLPATSAVIPSTDSTTLTP